MRKFLTFLALVGLTGALGVVAISGAAGATTTVALHNNTAEEGTDCPDAINDYWHFVLTPNDGSLTFVTITLQLDGTTKTFPADGPIIPNGSQQDNVFVQVPAGFALDDLVTAGSSAEADGPVGENTKFNLSHVCDGSGSGSLSVNKEIVANGNTVPLTFDVNVECTLNGNPTKSVTLTLDGNGAAQDVTGIPAGSTCTLSENTSGLSPVPTVSFSANDILIEDGDTDTATVTNTYAPPTPGGTDTPSDPTVVATVAPAPAVAAAPGFTG
jgi:hypothetical protein